MAESTLPAPAGTARTQAPCASCDHPVAIHQKIPATFCMECGTCVLNLDDGGPLRPLVMPQHFEEGAWEALVREIPDGKRAERRLARLVFVPWHEWKADTGRRRLIRDARAPLAPAADLLPAGLRPAASPLADDVRGLAVAETAHKGRLADPRHALDLIRRGEVVDVMIPPAHPAPSGAAGGSLPRPLYYPFWLFTYAVDHKERVGVVDAHTGRPVGPSRAPSRWAPALRAGITGAVVFAAVYAVGARSLGGAAPALAAGALSWAAAWLALESGLARERGR